MIEMDRFISASAGTGKTHTISKTYVDLFEQCFLTKEPLDVGNVVGHNLHQKGSIRAEIPNSGYDQDQGEWQFGLAAAQILNGRCMDKHH